jgi:solute carrier family 10 (sodium/bile acid cotransporter), member 7
LVAQRLKRQWFLLSLATVLAVGFLLPGPLLPLADSAWLRNGIVAAVLFLMALPLETRVVARTIRRPWAALLGSAMNMGLLPLLAWGASRLLAGELATGVIVAAVAPSTLASAAVWTRRAGGNDAAAILVTLLTNSTCFLTTPLWLSLMTHTQTRLDVAPMIKDLGLLVVTPMALAQLCRLWPVVARTATDAKRFCGTLAQLGILCMVLFGAVKCSTHLATTHWREVVSPADLAMMIGVVVGLHLAALWIGYGLARSLRMSHGDQMAVAFAGSQKTLMVGLYVAINYFGGLTILPMVAYHVAQLFVDTLIADRWAEPTKTSAWDE